ncbi:hypothetical protein TNIN_101901 [Trichonephila inaurata madagascariensis]|uniref:Uncharacterized protein n=1 Tax=Trichonephila inaurata madagascariensis TaxID=2747483 RepID=A0A8X7CC05_9ARAC|nr:hypothetical protein TNIN_101901 [Trichonephila inaurata madagascariensis]
MLKFSTKCLFFNSKGCCDSFLSKFVDARDGDVMRCAGSNYNFVRHTSKFSKYNSPVAKHLWLLRLLKMFYQMGYFWKVDHWLLFSVFGIFRTLPCSPDKCAVNAEAGGKQVP